MDDKRDQFTPDTVDEQVEQLSFAPRTHSPSARLVHTLSEAGKQDEQVIARVRSRLYSHLEQNRPTGRMQKDMLQSIIPSAHPELAGEDSLSRISVSRSRRTRKTFMLSTLAAVLVIGFLVANLTIMFNRSIVGHKAPTPTPIPHQTPSQPQEQHTYLYVTRSDGVYKLNPQNGQVVWHYPVNDLQLAIDPFSTVVNNDYVFFTANDFTPDARGNRPDHLFALDVQKGTLAWQKDIGTGNTPLQVAGGVLYVYVGNVDSNGVSTRTIYALNARDGAERWSYPTHGGIALLGPVQRNTLYVTEDNFVYGLNVSNGQEAWVKNIEGHFEVAPRVVDGGVYTFACSADNTQPCTHYVYDASNGHLLWQHQHTAPGKERVVSGPAVANGRLYQTSGETGEVYALDVNKQGQELWRQQVGQGVLTSPVVVGDTVYVAQSSQLDNVSTEGHLIALNAQNGMPRWSQTLQSLSVQQIIVSNNLLYCNALGTIEVRSASNGELVKKLPVGSVSGDSFVVAANS